MKIKYMLFLLGWIPSILFSQLGSSLDEVIEEFGSDFEVLEREDDFDYHIRFTEDSENSEEGEIWTVLSFDRNSKATLICQQAIIIRPRSHANRVINDISSRGFVEVSNLVWLDYSTNIRYLITIDGDAVGLFKSYFSLD